MVVSPEKLKEILGYVEERLAQANDDGTLHEALVPLGLQGLIDPDDDFDLGECDAAFGDILVLGRCEVPRHVLQAIAENLGYDKRRFNFVDYDELQRYDCSTLRNSMRYAAVMCGPVPHKAKGMGDTSSILEELRHPERGYPPLAELRESAGQGDLRISKTSFRDGLADLEARRAIRRNQFD